MKHPFRIALIASALLAAGFSHANPSGKVWITIGQEGYQLLQQVDQRAVSLEKKRIRTSATAPASDPGEMVHVVEVDEATLSALSGAIHQKLRHCGGYTAHTTLAEARAALNPQPAIATRPVYKIDDQAQVTPMLNQMQDSNIASTIVHLSSYTNRYYTSSHGQNASNWIASHWRQLAGSRSDVTVEQFTHSGWPQKSIIMTIKGTDNPDQILVLGGHMDSINQSGTSENTRAPGADDDASGVASMTEVIRTMMATNYKPRRTIKFMAYAAEEVGLRGSAAIAKQMRSQNANVVGVIQLDMTNYKGAEADIYLFTDYTDAQQNQFLADLARTYLPSLKVGYDKCGYKCSDHASWYDQGYAASFPFEATFDGSDPHIHTVNDTYANTGNQALHALKFSRLALAYAVELGNDGPDDTGGDDRVENFSGSVARGENKYYGPFKVAAGTTFKADMTGTGDADLYVRIGSQPTTGAYNCRPYKSGSTENCSVNVPNKSDVYVMVRGYSAATYNLKVTYRPQ
ncbi:M20/M25/M40 family metallo-hydrolase [Chitinimonas lacunae]|uniref:M20/M25/M40 family metallo-hydrolase n=1 Tax=Chitinimonas lacunae TaxID=1963018 RepID=A0ABV8MQP2_9NEIS